MRNMMRMTEGMMLGHKENGFLVVGNRIIFAALCI